MNKWNMGLSLVFCLLLLALVPAENRASTCRQRNVADLTAISELILVGQVVSVIDGFDSGVPYTEVTLDVQRSLKGAVEGRYTFRQFGLLAPRDLGNGQTCLVVTPDGWSTYQAGEEVVVFLYKRGSQTGLRTTVGLAQGKFAIENGRVSNSLNNAGLFQGVPVGGRPLSQAQQKMLLGEKGAVDAEAFMSFVEKAVEQRWFDEVVEEEQ
ncbi:MAG: hypothetical protein ACE5G2_10635 [Candidatus Krumholzibacteriia bacterium]